MQTAKNIDAMAFANKLAHIDVNLIVLKINNSESLAELFKENLRRMLSKEYGKWSTIRIYQIENKAIDLHQNFKDSYCVLKKLKNINIANEIIKMSSPYLVRMEICCEKKIEQGRRINILNGMDN